MVILGLTGSIGMGKTTAAGMFRDMGLPVHDADAEVHALMGQEGRAVAVIDRTFPGVVVNRRVDRERLGRLVFADEGALARLEGILHPMVRHSTRTFLARQQRHRRPLVVLDIPLLFETGADRKCDATMVVTARPFIQEQRVLRRPGMTFERLAAIRARQMPDAEKRRRADFVVNTGLSRRATRLQIGCVVRSALALAGRRWRHWARADGARGDA